MLDGSRSRPTRRVCLLLCGGEGEESLKGLVAGLEKEDTIGWSRWRRQVSRCWRTMNHGIGCSELCM